VKRVLTRAIRLRPRLLLVGFAILAVLVLSAENAVAAPSVSASPTLLDFGKVQVGTTAVLQLTITNTGDQDLSWAGFSYNLPFGTDVSTNSTCYTVGTITAGSQCDIAVTFSPAKAGRYASPLQAQFTLASDHNSIVATVDVSGKGRGCPGGGNSCA
jgi:Abnormal spindle-like microcephaly-assoc'd, ASPM-SPD-2-Hydin